MTESIPEATRARASGFIRFGGFAILVAFAIHIVVNMVLKTFPPEDLSLHELEAYLLKEASTWAVVHGLRYLAFVGIAFFAGALFMRTCPVSNSRASGWGIVGLLGAALFITNGMMTNGIETLVFTVFSQLSGDPKIFWALFHLTRVLFTGEIVAWGVVIGTFSVAGLLSATLPKWLAVLGIVSASASLLCGVFIVSILTDGWALLLADVASIGCLAWFLITGVLLAIRGATP